MPRTHLPGQFLITVLISALCSFPVIADDAPSGVDQVRLQIEQAALQKQNADKEFTLRQGAADVATQRVQELQKQLAEAQLRAQKESEQLKVLQETATTLDKQLADLQASIPQQEAADRQIGRAHV